jgi:hypothetical protein
MASRLRWIVVHWMLLKALRLAPADRRGVALEDYLQSWWNEHGYK